MICCIFLAAVRVNERRSGAPPPPFFDCGCIHELLDDTGYVAGDADSVRLTKSTHTHIIFVNHFPVFVCLFVCFWQNKKTKCATKKERGHKEFEANAKENKKYSFENIYLFFTIWLFSIWFSLTRFRRRSEFHLLVLSAISSPLLQSLIHRIFYQLKPKLHSKSWQQQQQKKKRKKKPFVLKISAEINL